MDMTELLRTSSLYRRLSVDDRARIAAVMSTRSYEKGDVIFREGDPSGRPRRCCCRAVSSSRCSSSSRRACAAVEALTQRLIELTARLGELSGGRVETRLARLLLKLADTSGRSERGGIFIPLARHAMNWRT